MTPFSFISSPSSTSTPTTAGWLESLNYRSGDSPSKVIKATGIGGGDAVSHYFSFLHCVLDGLLTVESSSLDGASLQVRAANTTPWQPAWAERAALVPLPSALPDGARAALDVDGKPWRVTGLRAVSIAGNPFALVTAANPEGDAG